MHVRCSNVRPQSKLEIGGVEVMSGESLKLLGFPFTKTPNVNLHVEMLVKKICKRTWALSKLRRVGFIESELITYYCGAIRPVAEYASPAFHAMIPAYLSASLERQQMQALKNIYGPGISAGQMREIGN